MYNETDKQAYIEFKNSNSKLPQNYLLRLFNRTAEYEERYSKDICNFTVDEIIDMYKSMNFFQVETITNVNSQLSGYAQWCLENLLVNDSQNHFSEFRFSQLKGYVVPNHVVNGIVSREELLSRLHSLRNNSDKFIMLCLFEGLRGVDFGEIRQLKLEDFNGNIVHVKGERLVGYGDHDRFVNVSDELVYYAKLTASEDEYIAYGIGKTLEMIDEGFLIRRSVRAHHLGTQGNMYRKVDKILLDFNQGNDSINVTSIRNSGKIHFVKTYCKKIGITPKEFLFNAEYRKLIDEQYNDVMKAAPFYEKFKEILED